VQRVLLIEEHDTFRQCLALLLSREPGIELVGQAASVEEGRAAIIRGELGSIDAVLTELSLADGSVRDLLKHLEEAEADVPVLVLTGARDRRSRELALELGAAGVLTKDAPMERIVASLKKL
jgi:DNA-binding NarL/FixJ family response regulator